MNIFKELIIRGIINSQIINDVPQLAVTNESLISEILESSLIKIYIGFDPTASSLHVGHLLPLLTLAHFQKAGHTPIALIGGATGQIGDPSGKKSERKLLTLEEVGNNIISIKKQLEKFLSFEGNNAALLVNNYDWISEMSFIDFLREVGKYFTVNYMMAKESVRARLEDREHGISYTEFSYMLMQSYDFLFLFDKYGCIMQGGGSDQWGNITAGCDLIRKVRGKEVFGITYPLVSTTSGEKFGKSEGNAIWLDPELTSPYKFYQFWFNTDDKDVEKYLKMFTFLQIEEIKEIIIKHNNKPEKRIAQTKLAEEITALVHGENALQSVRIVSSALFSNDFYNIGEKEFKDIFNDIPSKEFNIKLIENGMDIIDLIVLCNICKSKTEAKKLISGGGIEINNKKIVDPEIRVHRNDLILNKYLLIRRGKKNFYLIKFL